MIANASTLAWTRPPRCSSEPFATTSPESRKAPPLPGPGVKRLPRCTQRTYTSLASVPTHAGSWQPALSCLGIGTCGHLLRRNFAACRFSRFLFSAFCLLMLNSFAFSFCGLATKKRADEGPFENPLVNASIGSLNTNPSSQQSRTLSDFRPPTSD